MSTVLAHPIKTARAHRQPVQTAAPPMPLNPRRCSQAPTTHGFALRTCAALALAYNRYELHAEGFPFAFSKLMKVGLCTGILRLKAPMDGILF
jgi:hypothetical protein